MREDERLSQGEIDALLNQMRYELNPEQQQALIQVLHTGFGTVSKSLSTLLQRQCEFTEPTVRVAMVSDLLSGLEVPFVTASSVYQNGIQGNFATILRGSEAKHLSSLLLGNEAIDADEAIDELHVNAISEIVGQLLNGLSETLSAKFNTPITLSAPSVQIAESRDTNFNLSEWVAAFEMGFKPEGVPVIQVILLLPFYIAESLANALTPKYEPPSSPPVSPAVNITQEAQLDVTENKAPRVQKPAFMSFDSDTQPSAASRNIDMLLDVDLKVRVELGSTKKRVRDILELGAGSIIELDKLAGEPIDVYVNNQRMAVGEVVVIDENFGVRITDILSPEERIKRFG